MRLVSRRFFAILAACTLTVASIVPVTAQSSDSVVVTGSIVSAPLSIQISNETIAFGALDYRATAQSTPVSATGFLAPGNNGAYWVANTSLSISVVSPLSWSASACVATGTGLPGAGLYGMPEMPADASAASLAIQGAFAPIGSSCGSPTPWAMNNSAGEVTLTRYLGTWVQSADQPRSFTATVQFSVSN